MKRYYLIHRYNLHEIGDKYAAIIEVDFANPEQKTRFTHLRDYIKKESHSEKITCINKNMKNFYTSNYGACITQYEDYSGGYYYDDKLFKIK